MNRKSFLAMLGGVFAALIAKLPRAAKPKFTGTLAMASKPIYPAFGYSFQQITIELETR